jgi:hypothetical protein
MGKRLHEESLFRDMEYSEDAVTALGHVAREDTEHYFLHVIVDVEQEVPVGMLLAMLTPTYFGGDRIANDLLLMIEPAHRGHCGSALKEITSRYRNWGFHKGAKRVYLASTTGIEPERTRDIYEVCGFHQVGTIHEA